jgi:hypothetical protein
MTDMTREELITNLMDKLGVSEAPDSGVDLSGAKYALVVVMELEEMTDEVIQRLQSAKGKKNLRRMVAIPPKATIMNKVRESLQGTGIGVIDGRGFIIKPYSWAEYRSVTLGTP